jgi:hypothetical protein
LRLRLPEFGVEVFDAAGAFLDLGRQVLHRPRQLPQPLRTRVVRVPRVLLLTISTTTPFASQISHS